MLYPTPIGRRLVGDGAASVSIYGAGTTNISTSELGTFIFFNGATPGTFNLPQATAALVGKSIWFYKGGVGTIDINAYNVGDGTDDIEDEVDVENVTTDTMAVIQLKCTSVGKWSVINVVGLWS